MDEVKRADALEVIEKARKAFPIAAKILLHLCELQPEDAGNFTLRFEATEDGKFVFSKSAEKLFGYDSCTGEILRSEGFERESAGFLSIMFEDL